MLPTQPETVESIASRLPAALTDAFRVIDMQEGTLMPPATMRKHVFDMDNGIRIVAALIERETKRRIQLTFTPWAEIDQAKLGPEQLKDFPAYCLALGDQLILSTGRKPARRGHVLTGTTFTATYEP